MASQEKFNFHRSGKDGALAGSDIGEGMLSSLGVLPPCDQLSVNRESRFTNVSSNSIHPITRATSWSLYLTISEKVLHTAAGVGTYKVDEDNVTAWMRERHCAFLSQSMLTVLRSQFMNQAR